MKINAQISLSPKDGDFTTDGVAYQVTPELLKARLIELDAAIDRVVTHLTENGATPESVRLSLNISYRMAYVSGEGMVE